MKRVAGAILVITLHSFNSFSEPKTGKTQNKITVVHKSRPFFFRFVPKLKEIQSRKVITAKMSYTHPDLGPCTYEVVKDLDRATFFGWCNTKKIARRKTTIFELDPNGKKLPASEKGVELGLNEHMETIIAKINNKHKEVTEN